MMIQAQLSQLDITIDDDKNLIKFGNRFAQQLTNLLKLYEKQIKKGEKNKFSIMREQLIAEPGSLTLLNLINIKLLINTLGNADNCDAAEFRIDQFFKIALEVYAEHSLKYVNLDDAETKQEKIAEKTHLLEEYLAYAANAVSLRHVAKFSSELGVTFNKINKKAAAVDAHSSRYAILMSLNSNIKDIKLELDSYLEQTIKDKANCSDNEIASFALRFELQNIIAKNALLKIAESSQKEQVKQFFFKLLAPFRAIFQIHGVQEILDSCTQKTALLGFFKPTDQIASEIKQLDKATMQHANSLCKYMRNH